LPLERFPLLRDFTPDQIVRLRGQLEPMSWPAAQVVFRQGDPGSALYLVTRGRAGIHLKHDDGAIRLMTFGPGAVFGELAILDGGPRSATVTAEEGLAGFELSAASFVVLREREPDVAIQLLAALGRELSVRLRYANLTIQQLET
jgi:CRP-like cAMP-binding protein